uniref:uncharacterized protein LOC122583401 n=1 Tax=Erigeron canadensis TaxID=72917 RepID=UPI001CB8B4C8|nr:uncharacterized protein LOC122583401 [Erigeron canadensis]
MSSNGFEKPIPIEFKFKDIQLATNNFAAENLIVETSNSKVYKVQRLRSEEDEEVELINVLVHVLKCALTDEAMLGLPEVFVPMISENNNIISFIGVCGEVKDENLLFTMMVTKDEANGSLDKHLSSQTLTWIQRLRICVGVARAIRYLHHGVDDKIGMDVIHGNIKSSRILLDDNWEPKLFGFDFSVYAVPTQQLVRISEYRGALQYMDPAFEKTGGINHKSDVFSFGVVLFEVLFGQKASIQNENKWYFADLARHHYEEKTLDKMIDPDLRQQMDSQSLHIFSEAAYWCLKEKREQRLNTSQLIKKLEKALEHQLKHELAPIAGMDTSIDYWKGKNLDHLRIQLSDIKLATRNFAETNLIGSGGYGMVYRAELDHYDSRNSIYREEKDRDVWPKMRSIVAIKRILDAKGKQGFYEEIETLTNCKHQNIVSLLGFCDEDPHMILVYELVSNGSLEDYLESTTNSIYLTWAQCIHICLDIARGLDYLHSSTKDKPTILHRDIKSANVLLDNNWNAKIADFGLSKRRPMNQKRSTIMTNMLAGTEGYIDPEYKATGKLKKESDIYSFGIVLFEIMSGRLAYDKSFYVGEEKGIPSLARRLFCEGKLKEMVDPNLKQAYGNIFMINRGLDQNSLDTFSKIAYQCIEESQSKRPTMGTVISELEKALSYEENHKDKLNISIEDIKLATQNFNDMNYVGSGRYWKAYKGEVSHANDDGHTTVIVKRCDTQYDKKDHQFLCELDILFKFKHINIIDVVGYCNEMDERIVVYENLSKGSLDKYLNDASLTWMKRLKICIDVARGIEFLHKGKADEMGDVVIHGRIKSANILVDGDWNAKISNFDMSSTFPQSKEFVDFINDDNETLGYLDPREMGQSLVYPHSDIYSMGVVLYEILCGRLAWQEKCEDHSQSLGPLAKCCYDEGKLDQMVFEGIKEQIVPKSLTTFELIAYKCLNEDEFRPDASKVVVELEKALEFQEDFEIWKTKLPKDYKEILEMSKVSSNYSDKSNKELYDMLKNGILIQENNVWFSLGENGEGNEMISATKFWYKRRWSRKWRNVPESRFPKVAEVLDVSNLMIHINIKAQYLSPGVNYRVQFIFRFCNLTESKAKRMHVNLKYKRGNETLHAYFATWRDDGWMTIELCQFLYRENDNDFEVLLESFSRCYCGSNNVYVEGIEFQAINNALHEKLEGRLNEIEAIDIASFEVLKNEEIKKAEEVYEVNVKNEMNNLIQLKQLQKSNRKRDKMRYLLSKMNMPSEVNTKEDLVSIANTTKNYLVDKVNTKKYHILDKVKRKKEHMVNKVKDHLGYNLPLPQSRVETEYKELNKRSENYDDSEESILLGNVNDKKHLMLSAKEVLHNYTKVKLIHLKASSRSRFQEVVELPSQQVLRIKCRIESQILQPNTEYACYLVFKFSEKCFGLHCPVIVRDLYYWRNKEAGIVYFKSPSYWNLHDFVPLKREDGWMEVIVWKFNSTLRLRGNFVPVHLKMITYEGTLSGLILCGMEIRAI